MLLPWQRASGEDGTQIQSQLKSPLRFHLADSSVHHECEAGGGAAMGEVAGTELRQGVIDGVRRGGGG